MNGENSYIDKNRGGVIKNSKNSTETYSDSVINFKRINVNLDGKKSGSIKKPSYVQDNIISIEIIYFMNREIL